VAATLVLPASARPQPVVVGGRAIDVTRAPWHVLVRQDNGSTYSICGGVIIAPARVVTAAHCVYDLNLGERVPPRKLSIRAGISDFRRPHAGDEEQRRDVARYRVHPGFRLYDPRSPDDVAVLELSSPLILGGTRARAIDLPRPRAGAQAGKAVKLVGFGQQSSERTPDGTLRQMTATLESQATCAGRKSPAHALLLCASSPVGASCIGDSGGGLVDDSPTPVLIGIDSAGSSTCEAGASTLYANVAAPEVLRFIQGAGSPPLAPRQLRPPHLVPGIRRSGQALRCDPGTWSGSPAYTYAFVDSSGRFLQDGPDDSYRLKRGDAGRRIHCVVTAANRGGTGVAETTRTSQIH